MNKRALVLSGGASKGAFTAGVVYYFGVTEGQHFDLAVGTSTGSLVGGPALLDDFNYLENIYTNVSNADILGESFLEKIIHKIVGGPVDVNMNPLHGKLREYYINSHMLDRLLATGKELVVSCVCVRTGKVHFVSSNQVKTGDIKNETFVLAILASCCEPVFTEPVRVYQHETSPKYENFKKDLFYDGGIRDFIPLEKAVALGADTIYAVSTHPEDSTETIWGKDTEPNKVDQLKALGWTISALLDENDRCDRSIGWLHCKFDKVATDIENLARSYNLNQIQIDSLVNAVLQPLTNGNRLKKLYLIAPNRSLPTSLAFDPHLMQGYFSKGKAAAEYFVNTKGRPLYVNRDSSKLNAEETFA